MKAMATITRTPRITAITVIAEVSLTEPGAAMVMVTELSEGFAACC